ncbi:RDD family protein [Timonella sp. A28]|uniref:RDD family protein n=1 Tax=Timonella sp. A28 TaxID=3442640 RepID=UPI003EBF4211
MVTRKDFSSWLHGSPTHNTANSEDNAGRFGTPEQGSGSLASLWRRVCGLIIDWAAASAVSWLLFDFHSMATLGVFAVVHFVCVSSIGNTLGHVLCGIRVRPEENNSTYIGFARGLMRTILLCLVIPAVIWDADGRGLHDKAARTLVVRR